MGYLSRRDGKGTCMSLGSSFRRVHGTTGLCPEAGGPQSIRQRHICSDSQVAVRALAAPATRSRLVGECKEAVGRVAERNRLQFRLLWLAGHTGMDQRQADRLKSLGACSEIAGPKPFVGISKYWTKSTIKKWVSENHCRWWAATSGSNHAKKLLVPGETRTGQSSSTAATGGKPDCWYRSS